MVLLKRYFLSFLLLLIAIGDCSCSDAAGTEKAFENSFKGIAPFYGVTVARDTITGVYDPLSQEEERIVFSVLTALFSGDSREFQALSEKFVVEKERWFVETSAVLAKKKRELDHGAICASLVSQKVSTLSSIESFRDFLSLKGARDDCKRRLEAFVSDSILNRRGETFDGFKVRLREGFCVSSDKVSTPLFENKSREIFDFITNFNEKIEKRKHDIARTEILKGSVNIDMFERYDAQIGDKDPRGFFRGILEKILHISRLSERIYGEKIRNNPCLVIFNEMLFSKDRPLSFEEFTAKEKALKILTGRHTNILVHVNFLFESSRTFASAADYTAFMAEQGRRVSELSTRTGKQIFESSRYAEYGEYVVQFSDHRTPLNILRNQSFVFWNGHPLIHYLKSSYRTEADTQLTTGKFYELGAGEDEISHSITATSPEMVVAKVLKENLSTEICYDLEIGVRKKLESYPRGGKIHVVVSNTLSLAQSGRAENLPDHIPLIIHVDPQDQEILLRTESKAILLPETFPAVSGDPLHAARINQLTKAMPFSTFRVNLTNNNVFIFHIWDLQNCLQTALFNQVLSEAASK